MQVVSQTETDGALLELASSVFVSGSYESGSYAYVASRKALEIVDISMYVHYIRGITPTTATNTGNQDVYITGNSFRPGAVVNLTNGSISIPGTITSFSSSRMKCTFPLSGARSGHTS